MSIRVPTNFVLTQVNCVRTKIDPLGKKAGKYLESAPKSASLFQTTVPFCENAKRAHYHVCLWKHSINQDSSVLDPLEYGPCRDKTALWGFVNNKGADQPAHSHHCYSLTGKYNI